MASKLLTSAAFLYSLTLSVNSLAMEDIVQLPQEIGEKIVCLSVKNAHHSIYLTKKLNHTREHFIVISLVNKKCNAYVNNPHIIKNVIQNITQVLNKEFSRHGRRLHTAKTAKKLNIPSSHQYISLSNKLFMPDLTTNEIECFLNQGADANYSRPCTKSYVGAKYYDSFPLIFYACQKTDNALEIVKLLINHGANINIEMNNEAPLEVAVQYNIPNMVELLLSYNPNIKNIHANLLSFAIHHNFNEIFNLLKTHPAIDCNKGLVEAIKQHNVQQIQELLDNNATADFVLEHATLQTLAYPLRRVVASEPLQTTEVLQILCNNGIHNQQLLNEMTALARSVQSRAQEVLAILMAHGPAICENEPARYTEYDDLPDLIPYSISYNEPINSDH